VVARPARVRYLSTMNVTAKPQILCVDDETRIVEGLQALLKDDFDVHVATSAEEALRLMKPLEDLAVVVCDMRMPKVDGATLLRAMARHRPNATRILLTGQASREDAIRAVNEGQIFKLLTKPCRAEDLKAAINEGVALHRVASAERRILQETLIGAIHALMEVLAIANPVAFGRASQIKRQVRQLAAQLGMHDFWQLEAAALLSQLGYVGLPPDLMAKIQHGERLSPEEDAKLRAAPDLTDMLLEHIPRLEPVLQILAALKWEDAALARLGDGTIGLGARILGLVLEYDGLMASGEEHDAACEKLRGRASRYGEDLVSRLDDCFAKSHAAEDVHLPVRQLRPGMRLREELRTSTGALLVPKGFEITPAFVTRIPNIAPDLLDLRVRVALPEAGS
jgi:response regulator RpfG family c-di-GMP phosphodiesterase